MGMIRVIYLAVYSLNLMNMDGFNGIKIVLELQKEGEMKSDIKILMKAIKKHNNVIKKERDKLRDIANLLEDYLTCYDDGSESIDDALRELQDGIDTISEVV